MFEKIVLRRSTTGQGLSLGEIAEALLFYRNVHLVLDPQSFGSIAKSLGLRPLLSLLARKKLSAVYIEDFLASRNTGVSQYNAFITATMSSRANERNPKLETTRKGRLAMMVEMYGHSRREANHLAERLSEHIRIQTYAGNFFVQGGIPKLATDNLDDGDYVLSAVRNVVRNQVGFEAFADNLKFSVFPRPMGQFVVSHNIDFGVGNARRKAIDPSLEAVTDGTLLAALLDVAADVSIASHYGGDFSTSLVNSDIIRIHYGELLRRSGISMNEISEFKEIVLDDSPSLREVIDSGQRTFDEFLVLLDQSERFRQSVHKMGPDSKLVAEYFGEVMKEGWISKLPAKTLRFVLGIAIGAATSPAAGIAWSAVDTFLLDKLKGWRPNHFVDTNLKPFLDR